MSIHAADEPRKDTAMEDALETAIGIDRRMGGVAAFVFLRRLGVPGATIVRVLAGDESVRRRVPPGAAPTTLPKRRSVPPQH